jgi:hypothetical protein
MSRCHLIKLACPDTETLYKEKYMAKEEEICVRRKPVFDRIPKTKADQPDSMNDVTMAMLNAYNLANQMSKSPWEDLPPTQQKIHEIMGAMTDLLLYKNQKYGDSAINPKKIFYKGDGTNSILIRLDDKLGRVMSNTEEKPRVNDVADIIGYCTLLLISMGVTAEDIAKFKD